MNNKEFMNFMKSVYRYNKSHKNTWIYITNYKNEFINLSVFDISTGKIILSGTSYGEEMDFFETANERFKE